MVAFEQIHQQCRALGEAGDAEGYYRHNSLFHHCIYRATHNAFLEQEAARLHAMLQPYRRMQLRVRGRMSRSFSEHDAVVAAIRADRQRKAAEAAADARHRRGVRSPPVARFAAGLFALALMAVAPPAANAQILDFLRRDSAPGPSAVQAPLPAFPGALGWAARTPGGRGS